MFFCWTLVFLSFLISFICFSCSDQCVFTTLALNKSRQLFELVILKKGASIFQEFPTLYQSKWHLKVIMLCHMNSPVIHSCLRCFISMQVCFIRPFCFSSSWTDGSFNSCSHEESQSLNVTSLTHFFHHNTTPSPPESLGCLVTHAHRHTHTTQVHLNCKFPSLYGLYIHSSQIKTNLILDAGYFLDQLWERHLHLYVKICKMTGN